MGIESDIHQKKFKNNQQKSVINLVYSSGFLINILNERVKGFGVTRQQYNVLRILKGQLPKSASVNLIKDRMMDKMSDASRIVERLRLKGLITRTISSSDKRAVDIIITEKGLNLLIEMEPAIDSIDQLFNDFSPEELETFNSLLDKMRNSIS